jgi:hypothetical protein
MIRMPDTSFAAGSQVIECEWRPRRDLNPRYRRERGLTRKQSAWSNDDLCRIARPAVPAWSAAWTQSEGSLGRAAGMSPLRPATWR